MKYFNADHNHFVNIINTRDIFDLMVKLYLKKKSFYTNSSSISCYSFDVCVSSYYKYVRINKWIVLVISDYKDITKSEEDEMSRVEVFVYFVKNCK